MALIFATVCHVACLLPSGQAAGLTSGQEEAARKMYTLKCAKCHEFYEPSEYSADGWTRWMEKMKKKSHLKKKDYELLLEYTLKLREAGKSSARSESAKK